MTKDTLSICFDVIWMNLNNRCGGGFQYSELLISALTKYTNCNVYVFINKNHGVIFKNLKNYPNFKLIINNGPTTFYKTLKKEKIDLIHAPVPYYSNYFYSIPMVTTIHDLQHYYFPENVSQKEFNYREITYKKVAKASVRIITSYAHVKKDITEFFHFLPAKINVCRIGFNFDREIELSKWPSIKKKYRLPQNYLLYCANTWKHKNHINLIKALKILHEKYKTKISLICTGQKYADYFPEILNEIRKNDLDHYVKFLGYVPEEDKLLILNKANLVVIPTLYEGGCLPLMEAMQYGIPVICSNVTSLPTIMGDKTFIFDPHSSPKIAAKINEMLRDENLRMKNITNSKRQCDNLKWQKTIWQFVNCYQKAVDDHRKQNISPVVDFQDWKEYIYKPRMLSVKNLFNKYLKNINTNGK